MQESPPNSDKNLSSFADYVETMDLEEVGEEHNEAFIQDISETISNHEKYAHDWKILGLQSIDAITGSLIVATPEGIKLYVFRKAPPQEIPKNIQGIWKIDTQLQTDFPEEFKDMTIYRWNFDSSVTNDSPEDRLKAYQENTIFGATLAKKLDGEATSDTL